MLLLALTGCNITRTVVLYPIEKADIFSVEKGSKIVRPDGSKDVIDRDGWFLSDMYVKEVMKARIGR